MEISFKEPLTIEAIQLNPPPLRTANNDIKLSGTMNFELRD